MKALNTEELNELLANMTEKQISFCQYFMTHFNGTKAAIEAGYSENSASVMASNMLNNPNVQALLAHYKANVASRLGLTAELIVAEYMKIAFSNVQNYVGAGNEVVDIAGLDANVAAAVAQVKVETMTGETFSKTTVTLKLHSKLHALDKLSEYVNLNMSDKEKPLSANVFVVQRPERPAPANNNALVKTG